MADVSSAPLVPKSIKALSSPSTSSLRHVKSEERLNQDNSSSASASPIANKNTSSMTSLRIVNEIDCWSTEDDELTLQVENDS